MTINQCCLDNEIQEKIDSLSINCDTESFIKVSLSASNGSANRKNMISLGCDLPDLYSSDFPEGSVFFVDELCVPVVSTETAWKGLDGRVYREDKPQRQLWAWGDNGYGQLALNTAGNKTSSPAQEITSSIDWCFIASGISSPQMTSGIKLDGTLWSAGSNYFTPELGGNIGDNTMINRSSPTQEITSSTNWCFINESGAIVNSIKNDGTLWSWGINYYSLLLTNDTIHYSSPVQEHTSSSDWKKVTTNGSFTSAIKSDGTIWGWGYNFSYQIGYNLGEYSSPIQEVSSSDAWVDVEVSGFTTNALKSDGSLWGWGSNLSGILAINQSSGVCSSPVREITSSTDWCSLSMGNCNGHALKTDGTLWSWGSDHRGQLGVLTCNVSASSPTQEITSSTNWCCLSANYSGAFGIKTDGSLWGWGVNFCGELGVGFTNSFFHGVSSPVQEITSSTNWVSVKGRNRFANALKNI